jgi:ribosomal protein S18 acetylase RimI-like enzyme
VAPSCQRQGVGTLLLEEVLRDADEKGLQSVLGASPMGRGLYEKQGFVSVGELEKNLWEYEGGEGMGNFKHCIMRRPAKVLST